MAKRKRPKALWIVIGLVAFYFVAHTVYVVKSAAGIDLRPPSYGHHGWMFPGADWEIAKLKSVWHRAKKL
jgi:hypothetical protein